MRVCLGKPGKDAISISLKLILAQQSDCLTVYDAFYLALSEFAGCELWTADRRLYSVVTHDLPWVKWLGNYRP